MATDKYGTSHGDVNRPIVTEPIAVPDVAVSDVLDVEEVDEGLYRLTFSMRQKSIHDGTLEHVVCLRTVLTGAALDRIATKLKDATTKQRRGAMVSAVAANLN